MSKRTFFDLGAQNRMLDPLMHALRHGLESTEARERRLAELRAEHPFTRPLSPPETELGTEVANTNAERITRLCQRLSPIDRVRGMSPRQVAESLICAVVDANYEHRELSHGERLVAVGNAVLEAMDDLRLRFAEAPAGSRYLRGEFKVTTS